MEKISVIVPVYNAKETLRACVDSLLGQTHRNLEIILVDDGSTDGSSAMCDTFAQNNGMIVIHTENRGQSLARQTGLEYATGEYIGFMDADDRMREDMYEYLLSLMLRYGADISACGYEIIRQNGTSQHRVSSASDVRVMDRQAAIENLLRGDGLSFYLWNKLYKRSLFEGIAFPREKRFEDKYILPEIFLRCSTVVLSGEEKYSYIIYPSSSIHRFSEATLFGIKAGEHIRDKIKRNLPELTELGDYQYYQSTFLCYEILIKSELAAAEGDKYPDAEEYLIRILKENRKTILKNRYVSRKRKAILLLMGINRRSYRYAIQAQQRLLFR